jgi:hypothetical protein
MFAEQYRVGTLPYRDSSPTLIRGPSLPAGATARSSVPLHMFTNRLGGCRSLSTSSEGRPAHRPSGSGALPHVETSAEESSLRSMASLAGRTVGGTGCHPRVSTESCVGEHTDSCGWHEVRTGVCVSRCTLLRLPSRGQTVMWESGAGPKVVLERQTRFCTSGSRTRVCMRVCM